MASSQPKNVNGFRSAEIRVEGLTPEDLADAWEYYQLNQADIDEEIRLNNEA